MDKLETLVERVTSRRRPNRRTAIWAVLALIAGVLAVTALPANAGAGGASASGVQPVEVALGGQPNDCTASVSTLPSDAEHELRIQNPQDGVTYPGIAGVSITLSVSPDDKILDFVLNGPAVVFDVIIKGGQKSTHYDYDGDPVGATTADQNLHAPTKGNGSNAYSISHVSFCYQEAFAASGTVFVDADQDGIFDSGEVADAPREITAYSGSTTVNTTSATNGTYTLYLPPGTYTICEEAIADFVQTAPSGDACMALGTFEDGGYPAISSETSGLNFGNVAEICGQFLNEDGVVLDGSFELFDVGNNESSCENKAGQLYESVEEGTNQLNLPLVGSGSVAGIGVITKDFGSTAFVPLQYAQSETDDFDVLPWCALRDKEGADSNQFDPYLADDTMYPSLGGVFDDPPTNEEQSVSCKVYVDENAEGIQTTVVLIQDDPFWR